MRDLFTLIATGIAATFLTQDTTAQTQNGGTLYVSCQNNQKPRDILFTAKHIPHGPQAHKTSAMLINIKSGQVASYPSVFITGDGYRMTPGQPEKTKPFTDAQAPYIELLSEFAAQACRSSETVPDQHGRRVIMLSQERNSAVSMACFALQP